MSEERIFPAPPVNVEYEEFWSKANDGKLLLPRCMDTNQFFWYPRKISPFTLSANVEWVEAAGRGVIYTFSVMRRADPQYVIAYVRLVEGITMMTNIVECDDADQASKITKSSIYVSMLLSTYTHAFVKHKCFTYLFIISNTNIHEKCT